MRRTGLVERLSLGMARLRRALARAGRRSAHMQYGHHADAAAPDAGTGGNGGVGRGQRDSTKQHERRDRERRDDAAPSRPTASSFGTKPCTQTSSRPERGLRENRPLHGSPCHGMGRDLASGFAAPGRLRERPGRSDPDGVPRRVMGKPLLRTRARFATPALAVALLLAPACGDEPEPSGHDHGSHTHGDSGHSHGAVDAGAIDTTDAPVGRVIGVRGSCRSASAAASALQPIA